MDAEIIIILMSLAFSAFFSAVEIAFISANRLHLAIKRKKGGYVVKIVLMFIKNPSYFIATTLIGNTVALVMYGIFMANFLEPYIEAYFSVYLTDGALSLMVLTVQTILSTLLVLVTAEFLPKSISLVNPDALLFGAAIPMNIIYWGMFPFSWMTVKLSKVLITKVFRVEYTESEPAFGLTDLNNYINKTLVPATEQEPKINKEIFSNALEFKTIKVRDCMVPRKEILAVDIEEDIEELKEKLIESGHSKILIYENSIDNIVGYVHALALFKKPSKIRDIVNVITIVPETIPANELMVRFISERKSVAIIVDEYGGTSGLVTIEDIMEEIFGEIEDEYDDEDLDLTKIGQYEYRLSARHEVDYLNTHYGFGIPEGDYDTLGGFIIYKNKNDIPEEGDVIETNRFQVKVESMIEARIDMVTLMIIHGEQEYNED